MSKYTMDIIVAACEDYLAGNGSFREIVAKYEIPSSNTVRHWVLLYNANRELKDYDPKREVYMAAARRKTTIEERKEIDKLERLRRENKRLKRQLEENDMLVQLLKKVKEFEGR